MPYATGRTYYGSNGGPGLAITVHAHARRPAYLGRTSPVHPISEES